MPYCLCSTYCNNHSCRLLCWPEMLYTSLMVENHHRVAHLEGAVKHLNDESAEPAQQCNALRQEVITEEIEVVLLSATSLGEKPDKRDRASTP